MNFAQESGREVSLTPQEVLFLRYWRDYWSRRDPLPVKDAGTTMARLSEKVLGKEVVAARWRQLRDETEDASPRRFPMFTERSAERVGRSLPGLVLGSAVGDAVGRQAARRSAGDGSAEFGEVSSTAQLTFFMVETLISARVALRRNTWKLPEPLWLRVFIGCLQWTCAQGDEWSDLVPEEFPAPFGWLWRRPELSFSRNPDELLVERLRAFRSERGIPHDAKTGYRTCGPLALAPPMAIWCDDTAELVELVSRNAATTHDPAVRAASAALAVMCNRLVNEESLREAVGSAATAVAELDGAQGVVRALETARELSDSTSDLPASTAFPSGEDAVDALGAAVFAALSHPDDFESAVNVAVAHPGDSTAIAAMCGALLGIVHGPSEIPAAALAALEVRGLAAELIDDAVLEFTSSNAPKSAEWYARYDFADES